MQDQQTNSTRSRPDSRPDFSIFPTLLSLSMSVLVYLRVDLGYRLLQGRSLVGPVLINGVFGYVTYHSVYLSPADRQSGLAMMVFAAGILVLSGVHSRRGLRLAFREPNPVHTMSLGHSIFLYTYLFRRRNLSVRAAKMCELLGLLFLGGYFIQSLRWNFLGWWLIASAFSVGVVDTVAQNKRQNDLFDLRDSRAALQDHLYHEERAVNATNERPATRAQKQAQRGSTVATLAPELDTAPSDRKTRSRRS